MNEHDNEKTSPVDRKAEGADAMLEAHITRVLHEQAAKVHFSPALRQQIVAHLPSRRSTQRQRLLIPAFSLVAACVLIVAVVLYVMLALQPPHSPQIATSVSYVVNNILNTPTELATKGQSVSLDPTGHHLVYGIAGQPGVMYTTDLSNPIAQNMLAMQDARDVAWAPDGSALVTTIYPTGTNIPLLALVPTGKYMHLLGKEALAAGWLPSSPQQITYVTQSAGMTQLWGITSTGQNAHVLATMQIPFLVQRLAWSPDGHLLALIVTLASTPSQTALQAPSHTIYIMDTHTKEVKQLVERGNFTIGTVAWSPDSRALTIEQADNTGHTTLHTIDALTQKDLFTLSLQHTLMGLSWSPDSGSLIYSDGGVLLSHTRSGASLKFPHTQAGAAYPFWLDSKHILYMQLTNGVGQLTLLAQQSK